MNYKNHHNQERGRIAKPNSFFIFVEMVFASIQTITTLQYLDYLHLNKFVDLIGDVLSVNSNAMILYSVAKNMASKSVTNDEDMSMKRLNLGI